MLDAVYDTVVRCVMPHMIPKMSWKWLKPASKSLLLLTLLCSASSSIMAETIYGDVQHEETLPPLPSQFQEGATYSDAPVGATIDWFPIPPWMAGIWAKQGDYETFVMNLKTGAQTQGQTFVPNVVSLTFGHQLDASGTVWHANVLPFRADGHRGKLDDHRFVSSERCLRSDSSSVSLQVRSFVVTVDSHSQKVKQSKQQEEVIGIAPLDARTIRTQSSTRIYDASGKPMFQTRSYTNRTRTADFMPIATINGIDLRQSLAQYLLDHNMANLVPR